MMTFDIHQSVFNEDGEYLEEAALDYREQLMDLFAASLEGQALLNQGDDLGWPDMMMNYGITYPGVTPPDMTPAELQEILFDIFPRKVAAELGGGEEAVRELRAFWTFLKREFHLANADACLRLLDDRVARRLEQDLHDPSKFGMAKSMVMMGRARGFDMTTNEGTQTWIETYNAELQSGPPPRPALPAPATYATLPAPPPRPPSAKKADPSSRHKMARESRKRNRKKK